MTELRVDGVYIQFISSQIVHDYARSPTYGYNIFRIVNGYFNKSTGTFSDNENAKTLFYFGSSYNTLYSPKSINGNTDEGALDLIKRIGLDNLEDPLYTANQIFNLSLEKLVMLDYQGSFGPWRIINRVGDSDPDSEVNDPNIIAFTVSYCVNDTGCLRYDSHPEILFVDRHLIAKSARHPYVFYQVDGENNRWKPYYDEWLLKFSDIMTAEKLLSEPMLKSLELYEMPMDSFETFSIDSYRFVHVCDLCDLRDNNLVWTYGGFHDHKNNRDVCVSCSKTPAGIEYIDKHGLKFERWNGLNYPSAKINTTNRKIEKIYCSNNSCVSGEINGLAIIKYDNLNSNYIGYFKNNRKHGEGFIFGTLDLFKWQLFIEDVPIDIKQLEVEDMRELWSRKLIGDTVRAASEGLFPEELFRRLDT